jgi:hypothetical protein
MKPISWLGSILIIAFTLSACGPSASTVQPTKVEPRPTPMVISPTSTLVPTSTPSITLTPLDTITQVPSPTLTPTITKTPLDTLAPEKAIETIKTLLREPVDCAAPCFWGIIPGQTSYPESDAIFRYYGFYSWPNLTLNYGDDRTLSLHVSLAGQNHFVESIRITIIPEQQTSGIAREWSAYSLDTLIKRYGTPSRVDFIASWGPRSFTSMQMYFNALDLIVQYAGFGIVHWQNDAWQVCPLAAQFDGVLLWMGKNPVYPPLPGVPVEKATSLTVDEFSKLMTGDPSQACFIFNLDMFP